MQPRAMKPFVVLLIGLLCGMSIRLTQVTMTTRLPTSLDESRSLRFVHVSQRALGEETIAKNATAIIAETFSVLEDRIVLAVVAIGDGVLGTHVQRLVRSVRTWGAWKGRIAVFTDSKETRSGLVGQDSLAHIVRLGREDAQAFSNLDLSQQVDTKRFKYMMLEYIPQDPDLKDSEYILYLELDIFPKQPLLPLLQSRVNKDRTDQQDLLPGMYMLRKDTADQGKMSFFSGLKRTQKLS